MSLRGLGYKRKSNDYRSRKANAELHWIEGILTRSSVGFIAGYSSSHQGLLDLVRLCLCGFGSMAYSTPSLATMPYQVPSGSKSSGWGFATGWFFRKGRRRWRSSWPRLRADKKRGQGSQGSTVLESWEPLFVPQRGHGVCRIRARVAPGLRATHP